MLNLFVDPFQRGLFCDDENIMYPYGDDTITTLTIALVGGIVAILLVSLDYKLRSTGVLFSSRTDLGMTFEYLLISLSHNPDRPY